MTKRQQKQENDCQNVNAPDMTPTPPRHDAHLIPTVYYFTFAPSSEHRPRASARRLSPDGPCIMSIVSGYQNSKWRNSIGNVTFRTVRGRTIASEKVAERPLNTDAATRAPGVKAMSIKQMTFGLITRFAKTHETSINESFDKTKYGTARNYFMKVNYPGMSAAFASLYSQIDDSATDTMAISDEAIEEAVTNYATDNPTSIYRIRKSGAATTYLSGAWDDSANPIIAVVTLNSTRLQNQAEAAELTTGVSFQIDGQGLTQGAITLGIAAESDGEPTDVAIATALESVSTSDTRVVGTIAAAQNGKYLFNVKVGDVTILTMKAHEQGTFG